MPKTRKPNTTRKPPEPSDSHAEIEDWIRRVMPDLHPIVKRVDEMVRESIDGLQYAVKWKKAYYGLPELGWVIEMVAYDVSVNVVFLGGADFDPPPPLGDTDGPATSRSRPWRRRRNRRCMSGSSKRGGSQGGNKPRAPLRGRHACRDPTEVQKHGPFLGSSPARMTADQPHRSGLGSAAR